MGSPEAIAHRRRYVGRRAVVAALKQTTAIYLSTPRSPFHVHNPIEVVVWVSRSPKSARSTQAPVGAYSFFEEAVSAKMGYDKVSDHARAGAEYIVSADSSCLMHQQGCAERIGVPIKFIHIAQILNGAAE